MKLLIAASGPNLEAKVDKRFGHPKNYLIVDSASMEYESLPGPDTDSPFQGMAAFRGHKIQGAVSGNFGPNAFQSLNAQGIKAYVCRGMTVGEAVEKIKSGEIKPAEQSTMKQSVRTGKGGGPGGKGRGRGGGGGGGGGAD